MAQPLLANALNQAGRKPVGQVAIDWSNPLTRNLSFYGFVVPGGMIDLVKQQLIPLPNATIRPDSHGNLCAEYDGTNIDTLTTSIPCGVKCTYISNQEKVTSSSVQTAFTFTSNGAITRLEWGFSNTQEYVNFNSGVFNLGTGSNNGLLPNSVVGVGVDSESGDTDGYIYRDGVLQASSLGNSNFTETDTITSITIGGRAGPSSQANFRFCFLAIYANKLLSEAEHTAIALDRYQFLKPRTPFFSFPAGEAPPVARRRFVITG